MYAYSFILLQEKSNKTFFKNTVTINQEGRIIQPYLVNAQAF